MRVNASSRKCARPSFIYSSFFPSYFFSRCSLLEFPYSAHSWIPMSVCLDRKGRGKERRKRKREREKGKSTEQNAFLASSWRKREWIATNDKAGGWDEDKKRGLLWSISKPSRTIPDSVAFYYHVRSEYCLRTVERLCIPCVMSTAAWNCHSRELWYTPWLAVFVPRITTTERRNLRAA